MKDEYIIVNKSAIQKEKEELKKLINKYVGYAEQSIYDKIDDLCSQSTPLIPENIKPLQELVDEGYDPYDSAHHLQLQRMLKVIEEYLSNLKVNI